MGHCEVHEVYAAGKKVWDLLGVLGESRFLLGVAIGGLLGKWGFFCGWGVRLSVSHSPNGENDHAISDSSVVVSVLLGCEGKKVDNHTC